MRAFSFRAPGAGRERSFRHGGLEVPRGMLAIAKVSLPERAVNTRARRRAAAALERDLADVLSSFQESITIEGAEAAVLSGQARLVFSSGAPSVLEAQLTATLGEHLERAAQSGANIGLRFAPSSLTGISPGLATEAAVAFIERQGASAVVGITTSTQAGIQELIARGLRDQIAPVEVAQRIGKLAGLTPRQVTAVENFRAATFKRLVPVPEALTPSVQRVIDQEVDRYRKRQLLLRGRGIAETETQTAIRAGEEAFYDQGIREGAIEAENVIRTWRTVGDDRVCPICFPLHGQSVPFNQEFQTSAGPMRGPPAHNRCRCYIQYAETATPGGRPRRARGPAPVPPVSGLPKAKGSFDPTEDFDPGMQAKMARLKERDWPPGITPAQHESRVMYQGAGFGPINRALRKAPGEMRDFQMGTKLGKVPISEHVENLDGLLTHALELPEDLTLYRGIKTKGVEELAAYKNAQAGDVLSDKAFGSWTGHRPTALSFGETEGMTLRMQAQAGEKIMYLGTFEEEVLLGRNASYRVVSVEENVTMLKSTNRELKRTVVTVEQVKE